MLENPLSMLVFNIFVFQIHFFFEGLFTGLLALPAELYPHARYSIPYTMQT